MAIERLHRYSATLVLVLILALIWAAPSQADSTDARCDIYPLGQDHTETMLRCTFSQRQGYITIARDDGVTHELSPTGDTPGNFLDQQGRAVYRQSGLGDQGLIFRFPDESIYLYWSTAALDPQDPDNPTAPFSTRDYAATAQLRCRDAGDAEFSSCPAGVLRMEDGQASVVIQNMRGEQFTVNFMSDYVNASNREAEASLKGDDWWVTINGAEIYVVPLALIEGG